MQSLRARARACAADFSHIKASRLHPRSCQIQQIPFSLPTSTYSSRSAVQLAEAGDVPLNDRRYERPQPCLHLPLPPPLPYSPTSAPFERHIQILDQATLSNESTSSWEIFQALHPDLHTSIPPSTLLNLIRSQSRALRTEKDGMIRLDILLGVAADASVHYRPVELEEILDQILNIQIAYNRSGKSVGPVLGQGRALARMWDLLSTSTGNQLHLVNAKLRERYLNRRFAPTEFKSEKHRVVGKEKSRQWIRNENGRGVLKGLKLNTVHLGYLDHSGKSLRAALAFGSELLAQNEAVVDDAIRDCIGRHVGERRNRWDLADVAEGNAAIQDFINGDDAIGGTARQGRQDLVAAALAYVTGNVPEVNELYGVQGIQAELRTETKSGEVDLLAGQKGLMRIVKAFGAGDMKSKESMSRLSVILATSCKFIIILKDAGSHPEPRLVHTLLRVILRAPILPYNDQTLRPSLIRTLKLIGNHCLYDKSSGWYRDNQAVLSSSMHALCLYSDNLAIREVLHEVYHALRREHEGVEPWQYHEKMRSAFCKYLRSDKLKPYSLTVFRAYRDWLDDGMPPLPEEENIINTIAKLNNTGLVSSRAFVNVVLLGKTEEVRLRMLGVLKKARQRTMHYAMRRRLHTVNKKLETEMEIENTDEEDEEDV